MQKVSEQFKKAFDSKLFIGILYGIGIVLVLMVVFSAGMSLGTRRASFGIAWQNNYDRNFGGMGRGFMGIEERPNPNGSVGKVIKAELPTLLISDREGIEKAVLIKDDTVVHQAGETVSAKDIAVDDFVVVIGTPNAEGQIEAKFIRVMPEPGSMMRR